MKLIIIIMFLCFLPECNAQTDTLAISSDGNLMTTEDLSRLDNLSIMSSWSEPKLDTFKIVYFTANDTMVIVQKGYLVTKDGGHYTYFNDKMRKEKRRVFLSMPRYEFYMGY